MSINNEIQYKAALERYKYLDSLESCNISEVLEFDSLISEIYCYEEIHYPIENIDATRSDT